MILGLSEPASSAAPAFVDWGVVQISVANLIVVIAMVVLFVLALLLRFPGEKAPIRPERSSAPDQEIRDDDPTR